MKAEHAGPKEEIDITNREMMRTVVFTRVRLLWCREKTLYRLMTPLGRDGG